MDKLVLFEDAGLVDLLPLTYWRITCELRCGRNTLIDRIAIRLGRAVTGLWTRDWLAAVAHERYLLPVNQPANGATVLVNGRWLIDRPVKFQPAPFAATYQDRIVYLACDDRLARRLTPADLLDAERTTELLDSIEHAPLEATLIRYPWDLVVHNAEALTADWVPGDRAMEGKVSSSAHLIEPDLICVSHGAVVEPTAVIDAGPGPVYVSQNARIMPHAYVAGPAYIGSGTVVNPHARIYDGTTVGPVCKVGGEICASVIAGYSNKQHGGFLGHAYVGSWVNLGAGTVNSNLKNTYGSVRVPLNGREVDTGQTFFGAVIADHVKTGIQQNITTGTSIGFASMVSSSRVLPKFVPSFTWLTDDGLAEADPERLLATARDVMRRREVNCSAAEADLFREIARRARNYEVGPPDVLK